MASSTRPASREDAACAESRSNVASGLGLFSGGVCCPQTAPRVRKKKKRNRASEKRQCSFARSIHVMTDPCANVSTEFCGGRYRRVADFRVVVKISRCPHTDFPSRAGSFYWDLAELWGGAPFPVFWRLRAALNTPSPKYRRRPAELPGFTMREK